MPRHRPPFRRHRAARLYGGQPLALPQATTLPATAVTTTTASLNGSVNPEGSATSWWFKWGTTPAYGNVTGTLSAGSGTIPVTVAASLTGLTTGTTYHYAVVAQSPAGTVSGADVTVAAQAPQPIVTPTSPAQPVGAPLVSIPHFAYPFTVTPAGAEVVEQDSLEEVFACVQAIANCPMGACPELPGFGLPDLTFSQAPLDPTPMLQAVARWETRADERAVVQAMDDMGDQWQVALTTQTLGTSQGS